MRLRFPSVHDIMKTRHLHRILVMGLLCLSALMEMSMLRLRSHHVTTVATLSDPPPFQARRALAVREEEAKAGGMNRPYDASLYRTATTSGHSWRDVKVDFFANNGFSRALRTTAAMGEYAEAVNTTFVVYQGPHEDPYIVAFEHATGTWVGPIHVGTSTLGQLTDPLIPLDSPTTSDTTTSTPPSVGNNHGQASIVVDSKGYIHITYGGDGGDEQFVGRLIDRMRSVDPNGAGQPMDDYGHGRVIHASSQKPYDIREWTTHTSRSGSPLSWRGSECQFVKVPSEEPSNPPNVSGSTSSVRLYHFCRHGYRAASIAYQVSTDDGESWSAPAVLLQTKEAARFSDVEGKDIVIRDGWSCRFRAGLSHSARHIIAAVCSYNRIRTEPNTVPGDDSVQQDGKQTSALPVFPATTATSSYNGYYLELDTRTQRWINVKGQVLSELPLIKEQADLMIRALDTEKVVRVHGDAHSSIRPVTVAVARPGHPHLLFRAPATSIATGNKDGQAKTADAHPADPKKLWYVGWNGDSWSEPALVVPPRVMGSVLDYDQDGDLAVALDGRGAEVVTVTVSLTNQTHSVVQNVRSRDQGRTWDRRLDEEGECWAAIRSHHGRFHTSAHVVNGRPEVRMVAYLEEPVSRHDATMAYRKLYLIGTRGPLFRTRRDAEVCRGIKTSEDGSMCGDWATTSNQRR